MWSGPRNLSTTMMYSFGARSDFAVVDEPFYASYLRLTGLDHPMRNEILSSQSTDPNEVATALTGTIPNERPHFYQKHMTQHMVQGVPRGWMADVQNVFLIRHPARVVASYSKKREDPTLDDIGFSQQAELFDFACQLGQMPIVIDAFDIRADPEKMLKRLCDALGLEWQPNMLNWPAGGHADDGVWAEHWYGAVHRSSGFAGSEQAIPEIPNSLSQVVDAAMPFYQKLAAHKL